MMKNHSYTVLATVTLGVSHLLSVSQLCEMSYNCVFTNKGVIIFRRNDDSFAFKGVLRGKLYLMDFIPGKVEFEKCLFAKTNVGWLWH
jgi:hypothetical protein